MADVTGDALLIDTDNVVFALLIPRYSNTNQLVLHSSAATRGEKVLLNFRIRCYNGGLWQYL
jgi:hypothetical protein